MQLYLLLSLYFWLLSITFSPTGEILLNGEVHPDQQTIQDHPECSSKPFFQPHLPSFLTSNPLIRANKWLTVPPEFPFYMLLFFSPWNNPISFHLFFTLSSPLPTQCTHTKLEPPTSSSKNTTPALPRRNNSTGSSMVFPSDAIPHLI